MSGARSEGDGGRAKAHRTTNVSSMTGSEDVALVRNAEWVADYREDVILRSKHCPLVRVEDAVDVARYLREHEERVFVARELFEQEED